MSYNLKISIHRTITDQQVDNFMNDMGMEINNAAATRQKVAAALGKFILESELQNESLKVNDFTIEVN